MTIFCLRDNFCLDTAPVTFRNIIYRDYSPAVNQTCTATTPECNKTCTMTAKSTPYLSCHRDSFPAKAPGHLAGCLRQVTGHPCRQAPRYPDILYRDLTLGPLYCQAVISSGNRHNIITCLKMTNFDSLVNFKKPKK